MRKYCTKKENECYLTTMVPSLPWFLWNSNICLKGNSLVISQFKTKKGSSDSSNQCLASANGPAGKKGKKSS